MSETAYALTHDDLHAGTVVRNSGLIHVYRSKHYAGPNRIDFEEIRVNREDVAYITIKWACEDAKWPGSETSKRARKYVEFKIVLKSTWWDPFKRKDRGHRHVVCVAETAQEQKGMEYSARMG